MRGDGPMEPTWEALAARVAELEALAARVAELEALLEHCVYSMPSEVESVARALGLGPNPAAVAILLARSPLPLSHVQLDEMLPLHLGNALLRHDPEFRSLGTVKQFILSLRKQTPWMLRDGARGAGKGVHITSEGRARVKAALVAGRNVQYLSPVDPPGAQPRRRYSVTGETAVHWRIYDARHKARPRCSKGRPGLTTSLRLAVTCPVCLEMIEEERK